MLVDVLRNSLLFFYETHDRPGDGKYELENFPCFSIITYKDVIPGTCRVCENCIMKK